MKLHNIKRPTLVKTAANISIGIGLILILVNFKEVYMILWSGGVMDHTRAMATSLLGSLLVINGLIATAIARTWDNDDYREDV